MPVFYLCLLFLMFGCVKTPSGDTSKKAGSIEPVTKLAKPLKKQRTNGKEGSFNPKIQNILKSKIATIEMLLKNHNIQDAVLKGNSHNSKMSRNAILEADKRWRNAKDSDKHILSFITNSCGKKLIEFQRKEIGVAEAFITDKYGLNVCQTNKTTDYYQADEKWWKDTFASGKGKTHWGSLEYDESSGAVSIPIYVPIKLANKRVVGVSKFIIDINSIKSAL